VSQEEEEISLAKQLIRGAGLRATPARLATYQILCDADAPLTHREVAEQLTGSGIDKATVFRNLNDLVGAGILRRSERGDHVWRFEMAEKGEKKHASHPHFVCVDCGSVTCLSQVSLTRSSLARSSEIGEVTEILLRGHCTECV